jgi:hypothetical protein
VVWEDHLLPLLTPKDAARLGCTCKALKGVVRKHFKDIGTIEVDTLQAALMTFPTAQSVMLDRARRTWGVAKREALVEWLRGGGHGAGITTMMATDREYDERVNSTVLAALRGGALPSLKSGAGVNLRLEAHQAFLTGGVLSAMHELCIKVVRSEESEALEPQVAALGLVRQFPALAKLQVLTQGHIEPPLEWSPFIPPSLKALHIVAHGGSVGRSLLRTLPGMLGASGAGLERLEIHIFSRLASMGVGLVHVAQALRCCSPTLKSFCLMAGGEGGSSQLRMQWAELLAGVSACRELEVLMLPNIGVEPLFLSGTAFGRLTHLEIFACEPEHPRDAGVMGVWELMASGGLPALAKLSVRLIGHGWGLEAMGTRVAPAFVGVADTLTQLSLGKSEHPLWRGDEVEVGYELGVAVGKLRRLKDLTLDLFFLSGRAYHAVSQGLAARGGDRPLPLLWRVEVVSEVYFRAELLASLLLPSVRVFCSNHPETRPALLTACALRQAGYKHVWALDCSDKDVDTVRAIVQCELVCECTNDLPPE